jgi:general secretion pathway protein K
MKIAHGSAPRGIALIIVMVSIVVLAVLAGGFAYSMKVETKLAQNADSETELLWLGRSGVDLARWALGLQLTIASEPYDSLDQKWAGGSGGNDEADSPLADVNLYDPVELGNGKFTIKKIVDLERKFDINTANEEILRQALTLIGVTGGAQDIVNSILDWIDRGSFTRVGGAKSDYYQGLDPPYVAKNGPVDDLSELVLVKGITPEMVSKKASLAAFQAKESRLGLSKEPLSSGVVLEDLFTPISSGKLNINTAREETLQLIPGIDSDLAKAIATARTEGSVPGLTSGDEGPFRSLDPAYLWKKVPGLSLEGARMLQGFCDVRSRTFEVTVEAEVGGYKRQFVAVLGRNNPTDVQVLSFYAQ